MRSDGAAFGATPKQAAIAWARRHQNVHAVIVGAYAPDQIGALAAAAELELHVRDERRDWRAPVVRQRGGPL